MFFLNILKVFYYFLKINKNLPKYDYDVKSKKNKPFLGSIVTPPWLQSIPRVPGKIYGK